ncbi:carboxypeptidase-like regulatory domain-containing protein, partial [Bacteroides sp. KH569_7]
MFRQFRTVSMMLLLLGGSTGAVYAANPDVAGVYDTQQSSVCKGVVNDAFGPVIGASVVVKGSTNGVITDIDGNFSLSGVKEGDIIQISFVGYKTV